MLVFIAMAGLALLVASPRQALAKDAPAGPDGLPVADVKHTWKLMAGQTRVDTLYYPIQKVLPAACRQFEDDDWTVFVRDPARGLIVTRWKQIHHPLVWLFAGKMMARVTVELRSIAPSRTQVLFHGDLASHHSLEGNPILPAARRAYAKAFSNWRRNVIRDLTSRA